jgi:hypothetical protein
VQRTNQRRRIDRVNITYPSANSLRLNMNVRLSGIARIPNVGNLLAKLDLITNLHLDAAWAEMAEHQKASATNVEDDVIAALVVAVRRSDLLVGPAVLDEGHLTVRRRKYRLAVDVVASQLVTSRLVCAALTRLQNVDGVTSASGDAIGTGFAAGR